MISDIFIELENVSILFNDIFRHWEKQLASKRPSLLAAILRTFWKECVVFSFVCVFNDLVARLGQPLLLGQLLLFFR